MAKPTRDALLVGNGTFIDATIPRLDAPAVDVARLAAVLADSNIGRFDTQICTEGTHSEVRRAMGKLFHGRRPEDVILLYFSGHGLKDEAGHLHLVSQDTERELYHATSVDVPWLSRQMDRCAARTIVLILDCCFGGAFQGIPKGGGEVIDLEAAFKGDGSGRIVLSAAKNDQVAWQVGSAVDGQPQSVFTSHLLEGLVTGEADGDGDGWVDALELFEYTRRRMRAGRFHQEPVMFATGYDGKIRLAQRPVQPTLPDVPAVVCELEIVRGPCPRRKFRLPPGEYRVGRLVDCTIHLREDSRVSKEHALISVGTAAVHVEDTGSTNGTFVAGKRVTRQIVEPGTEIEFGSTVLRWLLDGQRSVPVKTDPAPSLAPVEPAPAGPTVQHRG